MAEKISLIIFFSLISLIASIYSASAFVLDDFEDNNIFGNWNAPAGNINWGPGSGSYTDSYVNLYEASSPVYSGSYSMRIERTGGSFPYLWIRDWEDAGISNSDLTKYLHLTMWVYDNDGVNSEFILMHNSNSAYDQRAYTTGNGWSRLVFGFGPGYIFSNNEMHIVPGNSGSTGTYYVDDVILTNCSCSVGPCCDNCDYKSSATICKENITKAYGCPWGINLGDDVGVKQSFRLCSGTSSSCNGAISWSDWQIQDDCNIDEICREDYPSCTDPSYTCYFDLECGNNSWIGSSICSDNNVYQNQLTYRCNNPGTSSSYCSNSTQLTIKERCLHGCSNNSCIISNNPPYLFSDQYTLLDDIFKQHINYFLSNQPTTTYGFPLTAYKIGDRARYGWSNPTEWGYLLQAWIAAAEHGIITKDQARSKIQTALTTMDALQNNPNQNYYGLFYPYYTVTDSGGNDIFPYHDPDTKIPSIDNGLLYASLLIVEGWSYENDFSNLANLSKTIKNRMNYTIFLFDSNTKISHQIYANNGTLNTNNYWNIYPDEGGLMAFIMYASDAVDFQGYETLTNNQRREQREWNGYVINESALFNAMFTWSVRSLAGFKVTNTPYSKDSFVPSVNAHLEYGDFLNIDYPGFSDAMTQAYEGKSLTGVYFPPNLNNVVPTTPPSHILPHAFFVPFNVLADLNQTTISLLINKISLLMNDSENYYRNTGTYNFGFTVTASPYKNDSTFTGTDDGKNVFETLSHSYIALSLFNALQNNNNSEDFYDIAINVPGYREKYVNSTNFLYPGSIPVCVDNDHDGYNISGEDCGPVDCNDNNNSIYPGAVELCNGVDDNCDNNVDENLTQTCGSGNCTGTKTCSLGNWSNCSSQGNDAGICAKCNSSGNPIYDSLQNNDCNNSLYCNGVETCSAIYTCQAGIPINCSANNLNPIATCSNNPDNNPFTWDYFAGFISTCNEASDKCTNGSITLTHTCNLSCGGCVTNSDCNDNNPNTDDICLGNCTCLHNQTAECVVPYDGMSITYNTLFCSGVYNLPAGISIGSDNVMLDCNNAVLNGSGSGNGIYIGNRKNVLVKNCETKNYFTGLYLENSDNNTLLYNKASKNYHGFLLYYSDNNTLDSNNAYLNNIDYYNGDGIMVYLANNNIISNNNFSNNSRGISVLTSENNIIKFNNVHSNELKGLVIDNSNNNILISNNVCGNVNLDIQNTETAQNNTGYNNSCEISVGWNDSGAVGCTSYCVSCVDNDNDSYSSAGYHCGLIDCNDNNNSIYPGAVEICDDGQDNNCNNRTDNDDFDCMSGCVTPYNDINITRSVVFCGGVYYVFNVNLMKDNIVVDCNNSHISPGWGTGIVFNVIGRNNVTLKNCRIGPAMLGVRLTNSSDNLISNIYCWGTNSCIGLYTNSNKNNISSTYVAKTFDNSLIIRDSKNNIIKDNELSNSEYQNSINLYNASNNIIENNSMSNNGYSGTWYYKGGASLVYSNNNTILNNRITNNKWGGHGFYMQYSMNNLVYNNDVINNSEGFYLWNSPNNTIYLNNIDNNTIQASDLPNASFWDYDGKGNYWSNYDEESEGCFDLNGNGFCDNLYVIDNDSRDNYPFVKFSGIKTSNMSLNSGWNLISIPVNISNNSVENVFGPIMNKVIVINGFESGIGGGAKTYDPLLPEFSDLHTIDYKHGYWVKMNQSVNLNVDGTIPVNKTINLEKNWNLISYLCNSTKNITDIFGSIMNKVIVINGFESGALTYDPLLPEFSDLQVMKPNYGYWVKMNEGAVMDYNRVC